MVRTLGLFGSETGSGPLPRHVANAQQVKTEKILVSLVPPNLNPKPQTLALPTRYSDCSRKEKGPQKKKTNPNPKT